MGGKKEERGARCGGVSPAIQETIDNRLPNIGRLQLEASLGKSVRAYLQNKLQQKDWGGGSSSSVLA
jgi:hypothetical protein